MAFVWVCIGMIVALGVIALVANRFDKGEDTIVKGHDCSSCSEADKGECKIHCLLEDRDKGRQKKTFNSSLLHFSLLSLLLFLVSCNMKKNTATNRLYHSFTARYNIYYNGSQAFIDGNLEKEKGNKDNYTEMIPLYMVGNKQSRELGKSQYDRAIEKSEKAIRLHSIKGKPEWKSNKTKTARDREWLSRKEYNPFIWKAWMLLGKAQFQKGAFDEAAATFSYMTRLYQTQPLQNGLAKAWLAKCYTELGWIYDAEDVVRNMSRDSIDYRIAKDWDYTYADYYIHQGDYEKAVPYLRKVVKHERRSVQRAREWFLLGQIESMLGHQEEAYRAFKKVIGCHPPYETEFNARIAQTEVMAASDGRRMISKLKRMAKSDNNQEYLDQVYYAMGNIYLHQGDTLQAIGAYEKGNKESVRNGIEKGVLLLTLGNIYWQLEKFGDAHRCYGEAIGLLDKDRKDYKQLSDRSKILDELVPHTSSVELEDSLQRLAKMPEAERLKIIDRIIDELKKKEKEEERARQESETAAALQKQSAVGNRQQPGRQNTPGQQTAGGAWYFYNPQSVSQGKRSFEQLWGKRENTDDWQRINRTVVNLAQDNAESPDNPESPETPDSLGNGGVAANDSIAGTKAENPNDTLANDPHNREYYLAQIPFTEEQLAASHDAIKDGLYHAGIIFKDKLDNLRLCEKYLTRLTNDYPDYEHNDDVWYHLFLMYSRQGRTTEADRCLAMLQNDFPESQWTTLLSDPYFAENQRFGVHIEDSLYAATYEAFTADRHQEVRGNAQLSESRFPLGQHRPKFLFIEGLSLLNDGDASSCMERMKQVVEEFPQSEVSEMAGMILRGVQQGRTLHGGKFDMGDVWSLRSAVSVSGDSTKVDTLRFERNAKYVFMLAYQPDSVNQNQLLYEMARYNFSNFLVRNFDIVIDQDAHGLSRMLLSGFLSYDEARQYARQLYTVEGNLKEMLHACRSLIVSEDNLRLLGTTYSYQDYEVFFEKQIEPTEISTQPLLEEPEDIIQQEDPDDYDEPADDNNQQPANNNDLPDDLFNDGPQQQNGLIEFDDDFWR